MLAINVEISLSKPAAALLEQSGFQSQKLQFPNTGLMPTVGDLVGLLSGDKITYLLLTERRFVLHPQQPQLVLVLDVPTASKP